MAAVQTHLNPEPLQTPVNPLLSNQKSSDTALQVALHPLVLLTISDYITRHTLRQQKTPIVGALMGQTTGRELTIEHAFDCLLESVDGQIILNQAWFEERLQQMKDVHKAPALDLVGWWTILPKSGPQLIHIPLHTQILESYNESAIILGFHPEDVLQGSAGGALPITIYESNYEAAEAPAAAGEAGEDKTMEDGETPLTLRFKKLPYTVETGEAEMISVDFVARGGGNATAVDSSAKLQTQDLEKTKGKGKEARASKKSESHESEASKFDTHILSPEDEELIASLTAKANAIKMLHSRINLISTYLSNLRPSDTPATTPESLDQKKYTEPNPAILRSIQALLGRLSLLVPADAVAFEQELLSERNDVNLVSLLNKITDSIKDVRETGRKFAVIEAAKAVYKKNDRNDRGFGPSPGWGSSSYGGGVSGAGDLLVGK